MGDYAMKNGKEPKFSLCLDILKLGGMRSLESRVRSLGVKFDVNEVILAVSSRWVIYIWSLEFRSPV